MNYVSTTTFGADPTPIECELTNLVPPPHYPSLEVGRVHPPLGAPTSFLSPISKSNIYCSPILSDGINYFYGPKQHTAQISSTTYLTSLTIGPSNFIFMGSLSPPTPSLVFNKDETSTTHPPMQDIDRIPIVPTQTTSHVTQIQQSDTLFHILFCGWMTLNCIILYICSIILGILWALFPDYQYQDTKVKHHYTW